MSSPDSSISAFGVSLIALGFNMWQWSKIQTSEQVDTSRELMDRVTAKQERLGKYEEKTYWNPDKGSLGQELDASKLYKLSSTS